MELYKKLQIIESLRIKAGAMYNKYGIAVFENPEFILINRSYNLCIVSLQEDFPKTSGIDELLLDHFNVSATIKDLEETEHNLIKALEECRIQKRA